LPRRYPRKSSRVENQPCKMIKSQDLSQRKAQKNSYVISTKAYQDVPEKQEQVSENMAYKTNNKNDDLLLNIDLNQCEQLNDTDHAKVDKLTLSSPHNPSILNKRRPLRETSVNGSIEDVAN
jgi:hypothetical protein